MIALLLWCIFIGCVYFATRKINKVLPPPTVAEIKQDESDWELINNPIYHNTSIMNHHHNSDD